MNNEKIAVLIPCYNEEVTIKKVIEDFKKELPKADIYVYNNNSKDKTYEIASKCDAIVRNEYNQGKGNVVRRMFREIDADIYVMVDADDTYPAEFVHKLIEPIRNKTADMVVGDRLSNGTYKKENKRMFHNFGNNLVKKAINTIFKSNLNDIMSGYRAFNKMFVKNIPVLSSKDFKPRKFFWCIGIIIMLLGIIIGIPVILEFVKYRYIFKIPSAILATGLEILAMIILQCGVILDTIVKQHREDYELNLINYETRERNNQR